MVKSASSDPIADSVYGSRQDDRLIGTAANDRLYGKQGNDWLDGGDGNDTIKAGSGNDSLYGGKGNDSLSGGNKGIDTAVYKGNFKQYLIQRIGENEWTIEPKNTRLSNKLNEGKDTLKGIELIEFNDLTYSLKDQSPLLVNNSPAASQLLYVAAKPEFSMQNSNLMIDSNSLSSRNFYVATNGDDTNPGTLQAPFKTIQHAITKVKAGDTVQIRGGIYREKLLLEDINGTKDNPITFENYPNEEVIISGAIEITTPWNVHEGNIWKTNVDFDVTQLFLDDNMLTAARWPNITKDWDQLDDSDGDNPTPDSYWDLKTSAEIQSEVDQKLGSYNNLEEKHSLSSLGASVEGAVFVRYGSEVVDVTQHTAGESSFEINGTVGFKFIWK